MRLAGTALVLSLTVPGISAATLLRAEWRPPGVAPATAAVGDVLAAVTRASGAGDPGFARRHERWTLAAGTVRTTVSVAVRGDDFRTSLDLGGLTYTAGRAAGVRWRGDGNGVVHAVEGDLQGDLADCVPQALFPLEAQTTTLAGESRLPAPAWVLATHRAGDKAAFLYVDQATGSIVREIERDGDRVVRTDFDRFEPLVAGGPSRPRHWHVDDGAHTVDVTVEAIEPGSVMPVETAFPTRRTFAADAPLARSTDLDATFLNGRVTLTVVVDGEHHQFVLDTGTQSILIDSDLAHRFGGAMLGHAVLDRLAVGPLELDRASALTVPFGGEGILGLDFFAGHVIEIDYRRERVRVLSDVDARTVFADPATRVLDANVDQGLPLVHADVGPVSGDAFALDTGSPHLYVLRPFATRFAAEIDAHWTSAGAPYVEKYLEGGIEVQPYRVARFALANSQATNITLAAQVPSTRTDDLDIPFDGIIGTDVLRSFDLYFDYDGGRVGFRQ